jgi:hypothetical protein
MGRQPMIMIATGSPGVGKSYQTKKEIELYAQADTSSGRPGRKVLIFDTNDEYRGYKSVRYNVRDPKDNGQYIQLLENTEIRRVLPYWPGQNGRVEMMTFSDKEKTLVDIVRNYKNGLILLEDINTYLIAAKSVETISMLCSARHKGTDIIIHLQSLSAVDTRMWQNATIFRMHYQNDDVARYKARINFEPIKIAQNVVSHQYLQGNIRFFIYYNNWTKKISGCTPDQYLKGLEMYENEYPQSTSLKEDKFLYFQK